MPPGSTLRPSALTPEFSTTIHPVPVNFMPTCILPQHSGCSLAAAGPCTRAASGRNCSLRGCLAFWSSIHHSHSPHCLLRFSASFSPSSLTHSRLSHALSSFSAFRSLWRPSSATMPRLRQRMRCRRGGSRGRATHVISSSSPCTSSSSFAHSGGRYPDTRSGRGRLLGSEALHPPSAPHSAPASAQLQFQCTSFSPLVVATVSISFKEISGAALVPCQLPPPSSQHGHPESSKAAKTPQASPMHSSNSHGNSGSEYYQQTLMQVDGQDAETVAPQQEATGPQFAEDNEYKCLIVEEPSPVTLDAQITRSP